MFSRLSLSSIASSITDLSSQVTSTVASTADALTSSVTHLIEDTQRELQLEQAKMDSLREQHLSEAKRPPPTPLWHVADESKLILEAELKQRILKLSHDPRTFLTQTLTPLPFSLEVCWPWAEVALREDPMLSRMRYRLVPRKVKERVFWRNYMSRVESVREELGVGQLFETTELDAELDRKRAKEERLKRKEEEAQKEINDFKAAKSANDSKTAAAAGPERKEEQKESQRRKEKAAAAAPVSGSAAAAGAVTAAAPTGRDRSDSDAEFISDDYVNVASQDVALVGAMKKELGIDTAAAPASAASQPAQPARRSKGQPAAADPELDALETMLADIDVADADAEGRDDDLLDELEGMQDDEGKDLP